MSEENSADNCVVTEAKETVTEGKDMREINVTRRVDTFDPENVIISTIVVETEKGRRNKSKLIEDTLENYSASSGYSIKTEETQEDEKFRRNGYTKTYDKQRVVTTYNESGAVDHAGGFEYTKSSTQTTTEHDEYDRNGRIEEFSSGFEYNGVNDSYRRNETSTFDYDEKRGAQREEKGIGASERYELKRGMRADARRVGGYYKASVQTHKGNRIFGASIDSGGNERYERFNGRVGVEVENENGELSGTRYKLDENGNIVGERTLSERRIKRELKKDREKADDAIRDITNGDVETFDEYMYSVEASEHSGNIRTLGDIFDMTYEQTQAIPEEKAKLQQEYDEKVKAEIPITADTIMMRRLAELQR